MSLWVSCEVSRHRKSWLTNDFIWISKFIIILWLLNKRLYDVRSLKNTPVSKKGFYRTQKKNLKSADALVVVTGDYWVLDQLMIITMKISTCCTWIYQDKLMILMINNFYSRLELGVISVCFFNDCFPSSLFFFCLRKKFANNFPILLESSQQQMTSFKMKW